MTEKQPLEARLARERLRAKSTLVLPNERDPRQCWLLVRQPPSDGLPGSFFVGHAVNYQKYLDKKFEVLAHSFDRMACTAAARKLTLSVGPSHQPKFSAHAKGPSLEDQAEPGDFNELPSGVEVPSLSEFLSDLPDDSQ